MKKKDIIVCYYIGINVFGTNFILPICSIRIFCYMQTNKYHKYCIRTKSITEKLYCAEK